MMNENELIEKQISTESIYSGRIMHVFKDTVEVPNGNKVSRELLRHVGAVGVVAMTDEGKVCIERQFRYPINKVITEIPAGKLDSLSEDRLGAAKRELKEETGLTADRWDFIGTYYPAAAYSDEKITLYLARDLTMGDQKLDPDEFLNFDFVQLDELISQIMNDEIPDGKTQVALLKTKQFLEKSEKRK